MKITSLKILSILIILLSTSLVTNAQYGRVYSRQVPTFVYGTWKIDRFVSVGGTAHDPKQFLGKEVTFKEFGFSCQKDFLFLDYPCQFNRYEYWYGKPKTNDVSNSTLFVWSRLDDESLPKGRAKVLKVCRTKDKFDCSWFEVTKNNELAIYNDGWVYILRKQ